MHYLLTYDTHELKANAVDAGADVYLSKRLTKIFLSAAHQANKVLDIISNVSKDQIGN